MTLDGLGLEQERGFQLEWESFFKLLGDLRQATSAKKS